MSTYAQMPGSEGLDRDEGVRLTLFTLLILALIGLLIVYTGLLAVNAERRFFREVTFDSNTAVARMVAREFTQVFANAAGQVEDVAGFPAVKVYDEKNAQYLFDLILRRHQTLRTLYRIDTTGKVVLVRHGVAVRSSKYRELTRQEFDRLAGGANYFLSREPYFVMPDRKAESPLAITFAVRLEEPPLKPGDPPRFAGVLGAEIDLEFIPDILAAAQVGRTGQFMVVSMGDDKKSRIVFSSRNMQQSEADDFLANFPVERAYGEDRAGFEYSEKEPKMASYARVHKVALEPGHRFFGKNPYPIAIAPARIPDWLIVVQQSAREGYLIADRMKWNIGVLVLVGLGGLLLIGKLWFDSLTSA